MNDIISVKDLLYIEDMMNWNYLLNQKIDAFIECVDDIEVKELLTKIKKMHKKHYKELLNILN